MIEIFTVSFFSVGTYSSSTVVVQKLILLFKLEDFRQKIWLIFLQLSPARSFHHFFDVFEYEI